MMPCFYINQVFNGVRAMNKLLEQAKDLLKELNAAWAFCGGFALELFLGSEIRKHGDIDICVFEDDRNGIKEYMLKNQWKVYQFLGCGRVRALEAADKSDPGRNLMCLKEGCALVDFYPCEESGVLMHDFHHVGMERLDYLEFLFNRRQNGQFIFDRELEIVRDMQKAILYRGEYPYIAPEIALLYKAANADNPEYQRDYGAVITRLDGEQLRWFRDSMEKLYTQGHPWNEK